MTDALAVPKPSKAHIASSMVHPDGTIIEMVYRPEIHQTAFFILRDGGVEEAAWADAPGIGRVVPHAATNNLFTHGVLLWPSGTSPYNSKAALLEEIREFIHRYADLSDGFEEVASYYVLLSWVYDAFNELPYLRLKGDFGSGKTRCLQTIGSLCYKPMFASGASTVSPLFRIIDLFRGTLIIDEGDFRVSDAKAEIVKILNNGNAVGFPVLRSDVTPQKEFNPRAFVVFGPKIIATRGVFDDRALESRCITEPLVGLPPRPDIPLTLPESFHQEAVSLRNKLLSFRFHNLSTIRPSSSDRQEASLEPRVAQVFAPLLSLVDSAEGRERVVSIARRSSECIRAERSASIEAQLLDIIYEAWRAEEPLIVRTIAERYAERYGADYRRPITARWIGSQLRSRLSLTPVKSHGVFRVSGADAKHLRLLFARFGFRVDGVDMGTLGTMHEKPEIISEGGP